MGVHEIIYFSTGNYSFRQIKNCNLNSIEFIKYKCYF